MIIWNSLKLFPNFYKYLWLFIYFRKYWNLRNIVSIKLIEKLSRRHLINSSNLFLIKGTFPQILIIRLFDFFHEIISTEK